MRKTSLFLVLYGTLVACADHVTSPAREPLQIITDRAAYAPGDSVVLTLMNYGPIRLGYKPCQYLERRNASAWAVADSARACRYQLQIIESRAAAQYSVGLSPALSDGTYRYTITTAGQIRDGASGLDSILHPEQRASKEFAVVRSMSPAP